jgi:elongation factor P hydroxylase
MEELNSLNLEQFERFERVEVNPHARRAILATSSSLCFMSSQEMRLPEAADAKPHCVLTAKAE